MEKQNSLVLPISIVIGAALIGGALYFALSGKNNPQVANQQGQQEQQEIDVRSIPGIQEGDAILGNPDAEVVFIEYSDLDCPACKVAHPEFEKLMQEYGQTGKVAWVYRHLPLPIHPDAYKKSKASECVYELGGNEAFWKFIKQVFENDQDDLEAFATNAGVDKAKFTACMADENFAKAKIESHIQDVAKPTNGRYFTPFIVVYVPSTGEKLLLPGAQRYEVLKQIVDGVINMNAQKQ